jgi:aminopeptidase
MIDSRISELADVLINYSCAVKPGEKILIEAIDIPHEVVCELVKTARKAGAHPLVTLKSNAVWRALIHNASEEQMALIADTEAQRMSKVQAYIGFRGNPNITEWSDIPKEQMKLYEKHVWQRVHNDIRVKKTKWVVLRWPNGSMAQSAGMSTEAFEDFYFDVCTLDYSKMDRAMQPLVELMNKTDKVRLVAPGTDLTFSIKGIPAISCAGKLNIPDGEVFTAPVKNSVNGTIQFNARTIYHGQMHDNVRLVFRDGKIVEATSSDTESLNKVLDTDQGARYVGEFALGFNPYITRPMLDILFDEKIAGSIHFTPGSSYDEAPNGNNSEVHWDMVLLMTEDAGGGEVHFDDRLVRKNGRFVVPELEPLNPENLK